MKNCFSRRSRWALSLIAATPFIILTCCTSVDDKLGMGFVPEIKLGFDTLGRKAGQEITARISYTDTVMTQNQTRLMLGRVKSEKGYGRTDMAMVMQFLPDNRTDTTGHGFGYNATVDSVILSSQMINAFGKKGVSQTFNIYDFKDKKDSLRTDTTYYMSYDWRSVVDESDPLFTFTYDGDTGKVANIKLTPGARGMEFAAKLLSDTTWYWTTANVPDDDKTEITDSRKRFREEFPGLVIAPAPGSDEDAAIYYGQLAYASLDVYYHNYKSENDKTESNIKDSNVAQYFHFYDKALYDYIPTNNSVICVEHDYTGTPFAGLDPKSESPIDSPDGRAYVQGLGGLYSQIEFPDAIFDAIDAYKEEPTDDIFISQAMLYIWLDNPDNYVEVLHSAHEKLGSYFDYVSKNPIPDYSWYDEYSSGKTIPYNGRLNLTHGYYEFNITSYLHHAYKKTSSAAESRRYYLAPIAYPTSPNEALYWKETAMLMEDAVSPDKEKQPMIKITYIIVK